MRSLKSNTRRCLECRKAVRLPPYRLSTFRFCSRKCAWAYKSEHERIVVKCEVCNHNFSVISCRKKTAKYCSRRCYYRSMKGRGSVAYSCRHSHKKFNDAPSKNRIYCSRSCVGKDSKLTWTGAFTTVRKNMLRRGLLIECEECGYNKNVSILGVHHKDRDKTNNRRNNIAVLCPNCHSLKHKKHITHGGVGFIRSP